MKRLFDKIHFSSELLSDNILVGGNTQNLLKFLVADTISATDIQSVELKLTSPSSVRDAPPTEVLAFTPLIQDNNNINIFQESITLTYTTAPTSLQGIIRITDTNGNVYINYYDNFVGKVV